MFHSVSLLSQAPLARRSRALPSILFRWGLRWGLGRLARELESPLSYLCLVLVWHGQYGSFQVSKPHSLQHLLMGGRQPSVGHVMTYSVMEEDTVLGNNAYRPPQAVQRNVPNVLVTQQDPAIGGVIEAIQQANNGRFSKQRRGKKKEER